MAALTRPIGEAVHSALVGAAKADGANGSFAAARWHVVHVCILADGGRPTHDGARADRSIDARIAADWTGGGAAMASGLFVMPPRAAEVLPPASAERDGSRCNASRRLVLPDARIAGGDLASHVALRRTRRKLSLEDAAHGDADVAAPDGTLAVWPAWARAFVHHRRPGCVQGDARIAYLRVNVASPAPHVESSGSE